ncbi:MAG: Eco47II family restriction endonuclease [Anaerolineae bacterium]|nr:Eco47II family restriction endonuclease [Anaerolineae bacterium]
MMLSWIDEEAFDQAITALRQSAQDALTHADKRRRRNVVDPFLTLLLSSTFSIDRSEDLSTIQQAESAIRGMSGALGTFHQSILGSVTGWENHDSLYDLKCPDRRLVAEVKNKWNTMNTANRRQVESDLAATVRSLRGPWTAYLVLIVPKSPVRYEKSLDKNVIETDGASFYQLVTGYPNAIHDLFQVLISRMAPSQQIANYCQAILEQSLPPRT